MCPAQVRRADFSPDVVSATRPGRLYPDLAALAAAVMAAGAVLAVAAFEKIGFIAPDPQALDAAKASAGQDDEAA
jgi:hypothetical protein